MKRIVTLVATSLFSVVALSGCASAMSLPNPTHSATTKTVIGCKKHYHRKQIDCKDGTLRYCFVCVPDKKK